MSEEAQGRRRPAPETAKDILGQLDTALGRIGRARAVAESAGFAHAAAALQEAERGIESTMEAVEAALQEDLVAALSRQLAVPVIDLDHLDVPQAVIELVPGEMAEAYSIIPFAQPMKFLDVAMGDPTNQTAIDELREVFGEHRRVQRAAADRASQEERAALAQ